MKINSGYALFASNDPPAGLTYAQKRDGSIIGIVPYAEAIHKLEFVWLRRETVSMLISVKGGGRSGCVELAEEPSNVRDDTQVIVTFVEADGVDLRARGISEAEASELRDRLTSFAEDWNSPEMEIYDNYDAAKAKLSAG